MSPATYKPGSKRLQSHFGEANLGRVRAAFEDAGGLLNEQQAVERLRRQSDQPLSLLAHWIVEREIVSFHLDGGVLVPLFQFRPDSLELRPSVPGILLELVTAFDDFGVASWFVDKNVLTFDVRPIDLMNLNPEAVLTAARIDCFIAQGRVA